MKKKYSKLIAYTIIGALILSAVVLLLASHKSQRVLIKTSEGDIVLQLYPNKAPITVKNFETYVKDGFYDGLVFHRVISNFMIQGGGFYPNGTQKATMAPIQLESNNGLSNDKYTIAMARTNIPNSATSQFFINTANNNFLNYGVQGAGYAVFGKVIKGQDVVDKIQSVQTTTKYGMENWPTNDVVIEQVKLL
jgi:cyclophilin family peptidyl-prolyl cis-trans isomerase